MEVKTTARASFPWIRERWIPPLAAERRRVESQASAGYNR